MTRKKPFLKRLFPHSPFLRKVFVIAVVLCIFIMGQNLYHFYMLKQQEMILTEERNRLAQEKEELQQRKAEMEDLENVENKARTELGLYKEDEVPYIR